MLVCSVCRIMLRLRLVTSKMRLLAMFVIITLGRITFARLDGNSYSRLRTSQAAGDIVSPPTITMSSSELFTPEERSLLLTQSISLSYNPTYSPLNSPAASPYQFVDESKQLIPNSAPVIKKETEEGPTGIKGIASTSTPSVTPSPEKMKTYSPTQSNNLTISGSIVGDVPNPSSTSFFNISDCSSYSVEWLIDLAETCNSASVKVTNITSLDGCVCTSANKRFAAGDISCNEKCPTSCETCDACFQLHCS